MKKNIFIITLLAGILVAAVFVVMFLTGRMTLNGFGKAAPVATPQNKNAVIVGLSFADLEGRWQRERDVFTKKAQDLGASVIVASADKDPDKQLLQAKNLIMQGVNVLVVVAQDADKAAAIVDEAHKAGIKVIAYDRLIKNSDLDYYLSFDNSKVGQYEAQGVLDVVSKGDFAYIGGSPSDNNAIVLRDASLKVLQPKIDRGDIKLVLNKLIDGWDPATAYQTVKQYLQKNKKIDAIVVANDGMALTITQALDEFNLAGKVPISGQDAELGACKNIIAGKQTLTVYKPLSNLAVEAAQLAVDVANGKTGSTNTVVNNGKKNVPSDLLDVVMVTKKNMQDTVIKDGFYTYDQVYK